MTVRHDGLTVVLSPDEAGGFVITSPDVPGLVTEAETADLAFEMARDAAAELAAARRQTEGVIPCRSN